MPRPLFFRSESHARIRDLKAIQPRRPGTVCGHPVGFGEVVAVNGEFRKVKEMYPAIKDGRLCYCSACLAQMTIRCGICSRLIFVGDDISLVTVPDNGSVMLDLVIPDFAAVYSCADAIMVACTGRCPGKGKFFYMRWAPAGEQRDGRWIGAVGRNPIPRSVEHYTFGKLSDKNHPMGPDPSIRIVIPERMPLRVP